MIPDHLPIIVVSVVILLLAGSAVFARNFRTSTLAVWGSGMLLGFVFLYLGSEILALGQWMFSTVTAFSFLVHALLFGDLLEDAPRPKLGWRKTIAPIIGAAAFALIIGIGIDDFEQWNFELSPEVFALKDFGKHLIEKHTLALVALSVQLVLAIVGIGVVARADWIVQGDRP